MRKRERERIIMATRISKVSDTLSLRCLLDTHLGILSRQLDRDKDKNLRITCVHKVQKTMTEDGIARESRMLMKSED